MVWICETCKGKNNNSSVKCRINKCHAPKPLADIKKDNKLQRDLCPKCCTHRDFVRIDKKRWKCPVCKKLYKFKGKPVPEYIDDGKSDIL